METHSVSIPQMLCCICGVLIECNSARMCSQCLRHEVDMTDGMSKQVALLYCKDCNRYQSHRWLHCEPESQELLALCLKKMKGLNRVKITAAHFVWTEPHSKRYKVQVSVQKEVLSGACLNHTFICTFILQSTQCDECKACWTPHTWKALVQIRQRVLHKRTFLFLEQLILNYKPYEHISGIEEFPDGLDFQFPNRQQSQKLTQFVSTHLPVKFRTSKRLISHDASSNTYHHKYTTFMELCPVCRDDLVYLPQSLVHKYRGVTPFLLCEKISSSVHLLDPLTLRTVILSNETYWKYPFTSIFERRNLTEFIILNIEKVSDSSASTFSHPSKHILVDCEIAKVSDFGVNDTRYIARTHLGRKLNVGDHCAGYDIQTINLSGPNESMTQIVSEFPQEIILVKKVFSSALRRSNRNWKLARLSRVTRGPTSMGADNQTTFEQDMEEFCQEIEENKEMQEAINFYRANQDKTSGMDVEMDTEKDSEVPFVELSKLIDTLHLDESQEFY